jgi:ComF family protein
MFVGSREAIWSAARALRDLAFPPACAFCLRHLPDFAGGPMFCANCLHGLTRGPSLSCPKCAAPKRLATAACLYCTRRQYRFDEASALGPYQGLLKEATLRSKQARHEVLTVALGELLSRRAAEHFGGAKFDWVTPIPMHWMRRLHRGAHGAGLLAETVAARLNRPLASLVRCRRRTRKQGTLTPHQRFANVRGAFAVSARYVVQGACVLLVDDVMTTGATVGETARVLKRAGAKRVCVLVAARGTGEETPAEGPAEAAQPPPEPAADPESRACRTTTIRNNEPP